MSPKELGATSEPPNEETCIQIDCVLWYASDTIIQEIKDVSEETKPRQVLIYADETGKEPFKEWLYGLTETQRSEW